MEFKRIRRSVGGRSLAAALLGTTFLIGLAGPALADSRLESENAELRAMIEDLEQEVRILKNMVIEQGRKVMEAAEPKAPAKMVTSGKRNVSLSVSGQVNRMILMADDGNESRNFFADNDQSSTRFRLKGKAELDGGWSAGTTFEAELESNSSASVAIEDPKEGGDTNKASLKERKLEVWFENGDVGKISLGQGSTASDGTIEEDLSGTGVITGAGFGGTGASLEFIRSDMAGRVGSGVVVDDLFGNQDGLSRKDRIRYDSPSLNGFQVSTSFLGGRYKDGVESGAWDLALRYGAELGDFDVAAAASTWQKNADTTGQGGSVSFLAPSGTSFTGAYSTTSRSAGADPTFTYLKLGQELEGSRALSFGIGDTENQGGEGNAGSYYDLAFVQKIEDLGTELYAIYGIYSADIVGMSTNDITITGVGARIKF